MKTLLGSGTTQIDKGLGEKIGLSRITLKGGKVLAKEIDHSSQGMG